LRGTLCYGNGKFNGGDDCKGGDVTIMFLKSFLLLGGDHLVDVSFI
jgi:hypothetical protein